MISPRLLHRQHDRLGALAQLGERLHGMQEVRGSTPLGSTIIPPKHRVSLNILYYRYLRSLLWSQMWYTRGMKDVSKKQYLTKRGEVWHYHRRVPISLVPAIGKAFIKKSLGVSDLKSAQRLRNILNVEIDAEFASAESVLSDTSSLDTFGCSSPTLSPSVDLSQR